MYFDTHAHYDDRQFDADRETVLALLPSCGVALVMNPGCDVESSRAAARLAERFSHVYAAAGIHPEDCAGADEGDYAAIEELCKLNKVASVGEIGL